MSKGSMQRVKRRGNKVPIVSIRLFCAGVDVEDIFCFLLLSVLMMRGAAEAEGRLRDTIAFVDMLLSSRLIFFSSPVFDAATGPRGKSIE